MRSLFITALCLMPVACNSDTIAESMFSVTKIEAKNVTVSGRADGNHEIVLRIGKTNRTIPLGTMPLEWTSGLGGNFEAEVRSTSNIPLGEGKFGKGIVFKVQKQGKGGGTITQTSNIAMSDLGPVPNGSVRFRPKKPGAGKVPSIKRTGNEITVADIICDDRTALPVTVVLRERQITSL